MPPAMKIGVSGQAKLVHQAAQFTHPRIGRLGMLGVLAVGDAVMAAGQPGIFVDDAAEPVVKLVIGALPQCPKGPRPEDTIG